jgi:hypothetical protein
LAVLVVTSATKISVVLIQVTVIGKVGALLLRSETDDCWSPLRGNLSLSIREIWRFPGMALGIVELAGRKVVAAGIVVVPNETEGDEIVVNIISVSTTIGTVKVSVVVIKSVEVNVS